MKLLLKFVFTLFSFTAIASPSKVTSFIKVDQFGYLCQSKKVAVIVDPQVGYNANASYSPGTTLNQYEVRRWQDDSIVFIGTLVVWNHGATQTQSGDKGWWFDFSSVTMPGSYYVYDAGTGFGSYRFEIGPNVYTDVLKQACRMFYYQRCNFPKTIPFADSKWTDAAAFEGVNQDKHARSRWDKSNPAKEKDVSGGWFDAGDRNKYVTYAVDAVTELLETYRLHPSVFRENLNIPESGNGVPDILDEVKFEIDWLIKMQDASGTGGLMLKVGTDTWMSTSPPSTDNNKRYYIPECTSSTLAGAVIFALGASVYKSLDIPIMEGYANELEMRAIKAWDRAKITTSNFTTFQTDCDDQNIWAGDADEKADWQKQCAVAAAVYLYEVTRSESYKNFVEANYNVGHPVGTGYWGPYWLFMQKALLRYASLPNVTQQVANAIRYSKQNTRTLTSLPEYNNALDLYRAYMPDAQYTWGSNMTRSACGVIAHDYVHFGINTEKQDKYKELAEQYLHSIHGVNSQGIVMLSNMYAFGADSSANEIYHTWFTDGSIYDNAKTSPCGPAPGFVTGGPNRSFSVSKLSPPYNQPVQKAYKDWNTDWNGTFNENSYECTEPAIYYQSMYIQLLAAVVDFGDEAPNEDSIITTTTPDAPALAADDSANTITASHALGDSEILVSENGGAFTAYTGQINVGNVNKAIGYWKFKIRSESGRTESAVVSSPAFNIDVNYQCSASGIIIREMWNKIPGVSIQNVDWAKTANSNTELTLFEAPRDVANNYASRIRGYICPPQTGNYTFAIAGDDATELWLSTDANPLNKRRIAYNMSYTLPRSWYKYNSQISYHNYLQAGHKYYIEALHKEATGGDNLSVAWQLPNGNIEAPIPGNRLSPFIISENLKLYNSIIEKPILRENENVTRLRVSPNPVVSTTTVKLLPLKSGIASLVVYDIHMRQVATIFKGFLEENVNKKIIFNSSNLPSGIYFLRFSTKSNIIEKKIIISKL